MNHIKDFYRSHADTITEKRAESPYLLRRYVHNSQYASGLAHVSPGMKVLDAGCGEGTLSILMAQKGAHVTGVDISEPNIAACKAMAQRENIADINFFTADLETLPFNDNEFDLVVSSHVREHLPDFDKGLAEILRVSKKRIAAAIPTVLSPCAWVQVGGGWFYLKGIHSFAAFALGFCRMIWAFVLGKEGVNETYGGADVPHIFRFPWIMKKKIKRLGFKLVSYEADSLCLPYFTFLLPLIGWLNVRRAHWPWRNVGYGTLYIVEK